MPGVEFQLFFEPFHDLKNDWAGECPLDHPPGPAGKFGLVQVGVVAAIVRAVIVDGNSPVLKCFDSNQ